MTNEMVKESCNFRARKRRQKLRRHRVIFVDYSRGLDKPYLTLLKGGEVESGLITKKVANMLRECGIHFSG